MRVAEDRSWAIELNETDFQRAYVRKFNSPYDIPTKKMYLKKLILKDTSQEKEFKYTCACGKGFDKPLDKARHVKKCDSNGKN